MHTSDTQLLFNYPNNISKRVQIVKVLVSSLCNCLRCVFLSFR